MGVLRRLKSRLVNTDNPFSKTQEATCAAIPAGVVSFLCLVNNESRFFELTGYVFAGFAVYLLWYKDKRDKD